MKRLFVGVLLSLCIAAPSYAAGSMARVKQIVSGNTLIVDLRGKEMTIKLYGIAAADPRDTRPQVQHLATAAKDFLFEFLKSGWVYLEFPSGEAKADKEGAFPALAYRDRDAVFINEKLVSEGFGVVSEEAQGAMKERLMEKQESARASSSGIWGEFNSGNAKKIASGESHQGKYIGEAPDKNSYGYNSDYAMMEILYWLRMTRD